MKTKAGWIGILASGLLLGPLPAQAIPVTYSFTTDAANLEEGGLPSPVPVSYTHLTLPTKVLVGWWGWGGGR